jgi:hypothetical protein
MVKSAKVFGWWCLFLSVQTFFCFSVLLPTRRYTHQKYYLDRIIPPPASESNIGIYAYTYTLSAYVVVLVFA